MNSLVGYNLTIDSHRIEGGPVDAFADVTSINRSRSMDGGGSWNVTFKTDLDGFFDQFLQRYVRDDDWISLPLFNDVASSPMIGLVGAMNHQERWNPQTGAGTRLYSMAGQDWSKCFINGQIRLGSILSTGTTKTVPGDVGVAYPFTDWPDLVPPPPLASFVRSTGRARKWTCFLGTGTVDSLDPDPGIAFQNTVNAAYTEMQGSATYSKAHFIVTMSGQVWALGDQESLPLQVARPTGVSAFDSQAVSIAIVGAGMGSSYRPAGAQLEAIGNLCRWLMLRGVDTSRPSASWVDGYRWNLAGAVAPKYGLVGVNEVVGSGSAASNPWDIDVWPAIDSAIRPTVEVTEAVDLADVPGIISENKFADVITTVLTQAYNGKGRADIPFQSLIRKLMPGLFVDPRGKDLLSRLSWSRFAAVEGIPYRLAQGIVTQSAVTPHSILTQYGCTAFNELFYDYDGEKPAVVYRPRPYSGSAWKALPISDIPSSQVVGIDVSRAGTERFNYWRSQAMLSVFKGADITIDTEAGRSPIIDQDSIRIHGLRVADPQDDFLPPLAIKDDCLTHYRRRIGTFRTMYYHNPEMVTGMVMCVPAQPQLRLGTRVRLPVKWWFDGYEQRETIVGYIVQIDDSVSVSEGEGTVTSSTTFLFVRGQPEGGLKVPPVKPWKVKTVKA